MRAHFALAGLLLLGCRHRPDGPRVRTTETVDVGIAPSPHPDGDAGQPRPDVENATDAGALDHTDAGGSVGSSEDGGACEVRVVGVLEAAVYAGTGVNSPAREQTYRNLDPETARRWHGRDHAMRHLRCDYEVTVNHRRYRYRHLAAQALANAGRLDPATCSTEATRSAAAERVVEFTRRCSDLHAAEYWGYRLEPLTP